MAEDLIRRGSLIKITQKEKAVVQYQKGIEQPLALLYNLITTKNQHQSEDIIQQ